jgi:CRISPR/Cas system-associated protein Cas10 (large subunit of type III CRISPR-Cas system)
MTKDPDEANKHDEPCLSCGEETAVGSFFYSDRHEAQLPDGTRGFLCSECVKRVRAHGHEEARTDELGVERSVIVLAQGWF